MANILGLITVNERQIYEIDGDPTLSTGTAAPLSTMAMRSDVGQLWLKTGVADTAWGLIDTNDSGSVLTGDYLRLPIYSTNATGTVLDDVVTQNSQNISVAIAAQATRSAGIVYNIPNPGDAITAADFILSQGAQTKTGAMTFATSVTVSTLTANAPVRTTTGGLLTTGAISLTSEVSGILPIANGGTNSSTTLNNNRILVSSGGAIVEAAVMTNGQLLIGSTGAAPVVASITGTTNRVTVTNGAGSITLSAPQDIHTGASPVFAGMTLSGLTVGQFVKTTTGGLLTTGTISLTADVTGILPIANGGTNSGTALNNNRIMVSSGGAIVEAGAMTNGQLLIGSTGAAPVVASLSGTSNQVTVTPGAGSITLSLPQNIHTAATPTFAGLTISTFTLGSVIFAGASGALTQDNASFFFDNTNNRLGLLTTTPARTLDINGSSILRGAIRFADAGATNANYEMFQAQVQTTDATVTTLGTIATTTDTVMLIEARVEARRTTGTAGAVGDSACYVRQARVKNVGGTVTIQTLQSSFTSEDQPSWNATFDVNTTNVRIRVTGAVNNTVNWTTTYIVQVL